MQHDAHSSAASDEPQSPWWLPLLGGLLLLVGGAYLFLGGSADSATKDGASPAASATDSAAHAR